MYLRNPSTPIPYLRYVVLSLFAGKFSRFRIDDRGSQAYPRGLILASSPPTLTNAFGCD